jgi:hypothetical protein
MINPHTHLDRCQCAQQHRLIQVAEMADAENLAAQLAEAAAQ